MVIKFRTGKFHCTNGANEKKPREPETGINDEFEEMEQEFPFVHSVRREKEYFSDALLLGKFFAGTNPKTLSCYIYFLKGFFRNGLQMANQPCLRLGKGSYFKGLYYYMRNFYNLIGLEQWYFSLI